MHIVQQLLGYAILGYALIEAIALFASMMAFVIIAQLRYTGVAAAG